MYESTTRHSQFNFWTLIAGCNFAAIVVGAGYQIETQPNMLSVFVCFAAISCAVAGILLLSLAAILSGFATLFAGNSSNDSFVTKCSDMALLGFGLLSPGLLFVVMMTMRSVAGFD